MSPSETISPTAHYTGYVWARNGLSHSRAGDDGGAHPVRVAAADHDRQRGGRRHIARALPAGSPPRDRRAAGAGDRRARGHAGRRGRERPLAPGLAVHEPVRRPPDLRRGRSAGHGGAQTGRARADRIAERAPPRRRLSTRSETTVPAASPSWRGSSIRRRGSRSSPRGCSAISTASPWTACGAGSPAPCTGSPAGATSPTCTSATCRRPRSARFACCCRRSCAVGSTFTSRAPLRRRRRCVAAGFDSAEVRRATDIVPDSRGAGSGLAHILEASTT